jgi:hypothetical protein
LRVTTSALPLTSFTFLQSDTDGRNGRPYDTLTMREGPSIYYFKRYTDRDQTERPEKPFCVGINRPKWLRVTNPLESATSIGYDLLRQLPAETYKHPECFWTGFDYNPVYDREQYQHGLDIGRTYAEIVIGANGVWSAQGGPRHCLSSEGIGYHSHTAALLRGFLDSPARVVVCRSYPNMPVQRIVIKETSIPHELMMLTIPTTIEMEA